MDIDIHWAQPDPNALAKIFDIMAVEISKVQVPLELMKPVVSAHIEARFAAEGPGWEPWSTNTRGQGPSILTRTGLLRGDATSGQALEIHGNALAFDFNKIVEYGPYNQFGAERSVGDSAGSSEYDPFVGGPGGADPFAGLTGEYLARAKAVRAESEAEGEGFGGNELPARPFVQMDDKLGGALMDVFYGWADGILGIFAGSGGMRAVTRDAGGRFTSNRGAGNFISGAPEAIPHIPFS